MQPGKLPMELLAQLLGRIEVKDPRVLLAPQLGADAAVLDFGKVSLVAKADPVTFATDSIGWYAVHVNANDVACLGARPRWFMATLLLPQNATEKLAEGIFDQVLAACRSLDVTLIGGHTEITYGLERPIVSGAMLGEATRGRIVRPDGASPGDILLLTKGIALEGTALLAREAEGRLRERGVEGAILAQARELLFSPGISVVNEALAACAAARVHAMHDPTEGGLATGLLEMARASKLGLEVQLEAIPLLPECRAVCQALGLDPLGLLASGSLLIAVAAGDAALVQERLRAAGVPCSRIGFLTPASAGLHLKTSVGIQPLPRFARDELARFLGS